MHSIFIVLAVRAGPHWQLDQVEAKQIADAAAAVARHYPVVSSQQGADWGQLMIALAVVFGPRAVESWRHPGAHPGAHPASAAARPEAPGRAADPGATVPGAPGVMAGNGAAITPSMLDPGAMAASHATA